MKKELIFGGMAKLPLDRTVLRWAQSYFPETPLEELTFRFRHGGSGLLIARIETRKKSVHRRGGIPVPTMPLGIGK